ncbi:site-2 protease family protein [Candidatus Microgenomates bacterium]|nr:site-2 protease family protein [Candidatus Microgenomates bacterium]
MFGALEPTQLIIFILALLSAITIHEFSHALMADKLGDPTPRLQGRLTLNPLAHLDPLGTILLFLVHFGWGKPVQFDPYNLANPRRDAAIISFAGPASNLILAAILALIARTNPQALLILVPFIQLNVVLAIFNLIPIHPLDGGKVLVGLLDPKTASEVDRFMSHYGLIILLILIFPLFGAPLISSILSPILNLILNILLPTTPLI